MSCNGLLTIVGSLWTGNGSRGHVAALRRGCARKTSGHGQRHPAANVSTLLPNLFEAVSSLQRMKDPNDYNLELIRSDSRSSEPPSVFPALQFTEDGTIWNANSAQAPLQLS